MAGDAEAAWTGRRMQMLGLVASAQTGDESQATIEALVRAVRGETSAASSRAGSMMFEGTIRRTESPYSDEGGMKKRSGFFGTVDDEFLRGLRDLS